ncbi:hypothetical protein KBC99_01285 [Candidatus Saccharibacteria bacterium]|nr:hypothetical protein [Candidatus Saccharibacteria bacterium]
MLAVLAIIGLVLSVVLAGVLIALIGTGITFLAFETDWFINAFIACDVLIGLITAFASYESGYTDGSESVLSTAIMTGAMASGFVLAGTILIAFFGSLLMGAFLEELEMRDSS